MSVFTSRVTRTEPIPHDPEHTVTYRKLAPKHLEASARASHAQALEQALAMGGVNVIRDLMAGFADSGQAEATVTAAVQADPMIGFDRSLLLRHGIIAWSYKDVPVTPESIEDLDEETQDFLGRAVLKLSRPDLFQTAADTEAERKNG